MVRAVGYPDPQYNKGLSQFHLQVVLAKKFGFNPEQFGENLQDNYQHHEVEQEPTERMEVATEYISK
jgi:hypothetical protein